MHIVLCSSCPSMPYACGCRAPHGSSDDGEPGGTAGEWHALQLPSRACMQLKVLARTKHLLLFSWPVRNTALRAQRISPLKLLQAAPS